MDRACARSIAWLTHGAPSRVAAEVLPRAAGPPSERGEQRDGLLAAASNASHVRTLLRFGLPLVPHSLAGALMAGADRLVLTGAADAEATGEYFAAYQICAPMPIGRNWPPVCS
mgnify:CR=1 FL=1